MTIENIQEIQNLYPNASKSEMQSFLHFIEKTGLDPLRNQIYLVSRRTKDGDKYVTKHTVQTSIDGLRLIAERTGKYSPGKESVINLDENGRLISATSYIKKMTEDGTWHEIGVTAYYEEYVQKSKEGKPSRFWAQMPKLMLAKCAEALALRRAFPDSMSGLYSEEEMGQAENTKAEEKPAKEEAKEEINEVISDEEFHILVEKINEVKEADIPFDENKFKLHVNCEDYSTMTKDNYRKGLFDLLRKQYESKNPALNRKRKGA